LKIYDSARFHISGVEQNLVMKNAIDMFVSIEVAGGDNYVPDGVLLKNNSLLRIELPEENLFRAIDNRSEHAGRVIKPGGAIGQLFPDENTIFIIGSGINCLGRVVGTFPLAVCKLHDFPNAAGQEAGIDIGFGDEFDAIEALNNGRSGGGIVEVGFGLALGVGADEGDVGGVG
jgi:hypothetical protein